MTADSALRPETERLLRRVLLALGVLAALASTFLIAIAGAERGAEFVVLCCVLGALWASYLWACRRNASLLLVPVSVLIALGVFFLAAENLLALEAALKFRLSNKLQFSPRLAAWADEHATYRTNAWEGLAEDPMFYRRRPGSTYRERYDYLNYGPEYEATVDVIGYRNAELDFYTRHPSIDIIISGDSVMESVGMPGVLEDMKPSLPGSAYSLSTGSYSPRQKVAVLERYGLPKRPRWLVIEFYAGNDASEIIEDEVCAAMKQDYRCRFDFSRIAEGLARDPKYAGFGAFGDFGPLMQRLRAIRSDSMTLALATGIAQKLRAPFQEAPSGTRAPRFGEEAITLPGFAHFVIRRERYLDWIGAGLAQTTDAYDHLLARVRASGARLLILYNPTSYEIYREVLPPTQVNAMADQISALQRSSIAEYAHNRNVDLCDLTEGFRRRVRDGARGLYGRNDGTHWSEKGRKVAAQVILECTLPLFSASKPAARRP